MRSRRRNHKFQRRLETLGETWTPWAPLEAQEDLRVRSTSKIKYFGVIVDKRLSFINHISFISSKIARNLGMMRKLKNIFPNYLIAIIYFSLELYLVFVVVYGLIRFQST